MQSDVHARIALTVIALGVVAMLALDLWQAGRGERGRYELIPYVARRQGSWLLRLDRETGRVWRIHFPAIRSGWELLPDSAADADADAAPTEEARPAD